jgi:Protein of unknown function with HXXEE motif
VRDVNDSKDSKDSKDSGSSSARAPAPASSAPSASARWWIWGLPLAFVVHDGEEALVAVRAGELRSLAAPLTVSQALAAICFELALFWLLAVLAAWSARPGWPMRLFGVALGGYTLHGLGHLAAGLAGRGYAFGVVTALPAVVVYGCLALYRLRAEGLLSPRELGACLGASAVLGGPFILLAHLVGKALA